MSTYHPIDVHVGLRIRQRRSLLGMSQTGLGKAVGLTFQQVQKYERGVNRLGSSRLFEFATVLDVPVSYFFDEMAGAAARTSTRVRGRNFEGTKHSGWSSDPLVKRETLELVRAYYKIHAAGVRRHILATVKALGAGVRVKRRGKKAKR